jgi:hypothetical protein
VKRLLKNNRAEVEVVRVLRGTLKQGQLVKTRVSHDNGKVGKLVCVFLPHVWVPWQRAVDLEDEVRFLLRKKPRITDMADAVRRVQDISDLGSGMGMKYIRRHRKQATALLIKTIEQRKALVFSGKRGFWGDRRLRKLIIALLTSVDAKTRAYVLREVQSLLGHKWLDLPKMKERHHVPNKPDSRGEYLEWMLSFLKDSRLQKEAGRRLLKGLPRLRGRGIACVVFALVYSGSVSPASFKRSPRAKRNDALALGLYFALNAGGGNIPLASPVKRPDREVLKTRIRALTKNAALLELVALSE